MPTWTYRTQPSYSKGKSWFRSVSVLAHLDLSPYLRRILDWLRMTWTSASGSLPPWFWSCKHGKERSLWFYTLQRTIFVYSLDKPECNWRGWLRDITVNNFSIISDVERRSPTVSLPQAITRFRCISLEFIYFRHDSLQFSDLKRVVCDPNLVCCMSSASFTCWMYLVANIYRYPQPFLPITKPDPDTCTCLCKLCKRNCHWYLLPKHLLCRSWCRCQNFPHPTFYV